MDPWRKRLKELIEERPDLSMKRLSLDAGLSESAVRDIVNRGSTPTVDTFCAIAKAAGVSPAWLLQGDERFHAKIPLLGIASGGEGWTPLEGPAARRAHDVVEFDMSNVDTFAIEVRGDSMSPVYRNHDQLFCRRHVGAGVDNLIGSDCVVRTAGGDNYIKILARGSRLGVYNLRSYNPVFQDVENVQLEWAAPIVWIRRGAR